MLCPELHVLCCHPLKRYAALTSHYSAWQTQTPLVDTAALRHACAMGTHARVRLGNARALNAQWGQPQFPLLLRPTTHSDCGHMAASEPTQ
jgi:hypothetical protein